MVKKEYIKVYKKILTDNHLGDAQAGVEAFVRRLEEMYASEKYKEHNIYPSMNVESIYVQNDYFPGGSCELYRPLEAEKKIKELIDDSRASGRKIIYIQHINPPDDYFFIEGTDGVKISDRIKPAEEDKIIIKHYPNSFLETDLNEYLKSIGVEELIICGMMTHMCVDTTVRAAMDYGYSVKVVGDACATMDLAINGETVPADMVQKAFLAALDGVFL